MKVMVIVKATASSEAGVMPSTELLAAMGKFNQELVDAGIMQTGEGLHPSSRGVRVRFSGAARTVTNGPFAETKELIAGYWLWNVASMEEAIRWVKRCPNPMPEDSEIEIRRVFEPADFGDALTPELRDQDAMQRATTLGLSLARFESGNAKRIAGLNESYTFESRVNIPKQWDRFAPQIGTVPGQIGSDAYGVAWNYRPQEGFDYLAGVEVAATTTLPPGYTAVSLEPHRYAIFSHHDHVASIGKTIDLIWTQWLPACGLQSAAAPCFERYTSEFNPHTGMGGMEIWIPLQP